ncbi:MAG: AmmeMemoRadiSam system protein B [Treponema sp.]|jgi:AmmeMemoRadiSam system protein B|nr:AmmeMemoRadiSam system protein B [Treponema sp.]
MEDYTPVCEKVRSPVVGGLFYPDNGEETEEQLLRFRMKEGKGLAQAILAPHGSWDISGNIAGAAFSAAMGRAEKAGGNLSGVSRVAILGPIHKAHEEGIFLTDSDCFLTPLGNIPVDREMTDELASCGTRLEINDIPHLAEHSIEVLLPFVKYCFPGAAIIPVLMGGTRPALISVLARALRLVLEPVMDESLIVVSCNLAMNGARELALEEAEECVRLLRGKDAETFGRGLREGRISACGGGLIAALLECGLVSDLAADVISGPIVTSRDEKNRTVYYGALSYG